MDYRSRDQELYEAWKTTGDQQALAELVNQLMPLIQKEVSRASGTLPEAALTAQAKKWAVKAIKEYNPSKGTSISTFVHSYLRKVRRFNYEYQNSARLPENLHLQYAPFKKAESELTEKLNRNPTEEELAHHLGWSKKQVVRFNKSLYDDNYESGSAYDSEVGSFNRNKMIQDHIMTQLDPIEREILMNGKKLSSAQLAKKLNINVPRLNYVKSKMIKKIKNIQEEFEVNDR